MVKVTKVTIGFKDEVEDVIYSSIDSIETQDNIISLYFEGKLMALINKDQLNYIDFEGGIEEC